MRLLFRALVLLAAATACASALAQSGGLRVRVTDGGTGSPVAGATIVLSSATQQVATTTTRTDAAGLAEFPVLRAGGGYLVRVSAPGYATLDLADLRVSPERVQVVPVGLFPEVHESVGVTAWSAESSATDVSPMMTSLGSSALRATAIKVVLSPRFISRTPFVCRPALRTCSARVLMTPPLEVMA